MISYSVTSSECEHVRSESVDQCAILLIMLPLPCDTARADILEVFLLCVSEGGVKAHNSPLVFFWLKEKKIQTCARPSPFFSGRCDSCWRWWDGCLCVKEILLLFYTIMMFCLISDCCAKCWFPPCACNSLLSVETPGLLIIAIPSCSQHVDCLCPMRTWIGSLMYCLNLF